MRKSIIVLLGMIFISISCQKEDSNFKSVQVGMTGVVQKGPFITGSSIIIQELDNTYIPNGTNYFTSTIDDFGSFSLNSIINTKYIEVIAQGFYFNEVSGELSFANLSLRSLVEIEKDLTSNVNVLTTLSKDRIIYLMNFEELSFEAAQAKAEQEVLQIFGITEEEIEHFCKMDISKNSNSDAILIAISAILQGSNSVAELAELIAKISLDIQEDGKIDESKFLTILQDNSKALNLIENRVNLENRYNSLGLVISIPNFEKYAKRLVLLAVTTTSPISNDEKINRYAEISIGFNKPIDESSISSNSFIVSDGTSDVAGTYHYNKETYEVAFRPDVELRPLTTYYIILNNNVKGIDGLALETIYKFNFLTESFDIESNLSNHYIFSGNSEDQSGNNRDATLNGVILTNDRYDVYNNAAQFNGESNYIDIPRSINPVDSEWTFSIWLKINELPSNHNDAYFLTRKNHDNDSDIYLYIDNDDNKIKTGIVDGHYKLSSGVAVNIGQWYHAVMSNSSGEISIYVNGELKVTSTKRFTCNMLINEPFRISCLYNGLWDDMPELGRIFGVIDDCRLYERCLNGREVELLHEYESGK